MTREPNHADALHLVRNQRIGCGPAGEHQNGEKLSLKQSLKEKKVRHLIYFYPKETRS